MSKKNNRKAPATPEYSLSRYLWLGGGLGLYFGYFFRPVGDPNFITPLGISVLIAGFLLVFRLFRSDRPSVGQLVKDFFVNLVLYAVILTILEARHLALDWGGRWAVIGMTTLMGVGVGYIMSKRGSFINSG